MRIKILSFFLSFLLLLSPSFAFAESTENVTTTTTSTTTLETTAVPLKESRMTLKKDFMEEIKEKRTENAEKMKTRREAYKAKMEEIKDAKKKSLVESLDTRISSINKKNTDQMATHIEKLTLLLERISSKAATLKAEGKNTTTLDSSITKATTALNAAKTAVATQAAKEYVFTITSETTLKTDVSPVVKQFRTDITATHKLLIAARLAVGDAAKELQAIKTPDVSVTATP